MGAGERVYPSATGGGWDEERNLAAAGDKWLIVAVLVVSEVRRGLTLRGPASGWDHSLSFLTGPLGVIRITP